MKQTIQALATIAVAVGLAVAAQAHGIDQQTTGQTMQRHATAQTQHRTAANHEMRQGRASRDQIKEAQQQLKAEGLFKGRVDGRMTSQFKVALSRFQQQNGLHRTGTLDRNTMARLGGGPGVGSSMPSLSDQTTAPNAPMNTPATPSTNLPSTGAGGTNGGTSAPKY